MIGRLPVFPRASLKMRSRFGVRFAEMQPDEQAITRIITRGSPERPSRVERNRLGQVEYKTGLEKACILKFSRFVLPNAG
jgi:hypothetical protein